MRFIKALTKSLLCTTGLTLFIAIVAFVASLLVTEFGGVGAILICIGVLFVGMFTRVFYDASY